MPVGIRFSHFNCRGKTGDGSLSLRQGTVLCLEGQGQGDGSVVPSTESQNRPKDRGRFSVLTARGQRDGSVVPSGEP